MDKHKNNANILHSMKIREVVANNPETIVNHVVNHFQDFLNLSSILQDSSLVDEFIPTLINVHANNFLIMLPTMDEVHHKVFSLKNDSAPGPNGFCLFYSN